MEGCVCLIVTNVAASAELAEVCALLSAIPVISDTIKVKKVKEVDLYSALLKYLTLKALRYRSHSVTCKLHRTCLYLVSIHQMAHPRLRLRTSNNIAAYYSFIYPKG